MRLINADALLKRIEDSARNAGFHQADYCKIKRFIAKTPTIEAEPVRHGEWRKFNDEIYCSLCECTALMGTYGGIIKSTYCPHCGAKMYGGVTDG